MKILYFDCFSGISGDMTIGALLDLGIDIEVFKAELSKLKLDGYELQIKEKIINGIVGIDFNVVLTGEHEHEHDHAHQDDHGHKHGHDHRHGHDHDYNHEHGHGNEHTHDRNHDHDHEHNYEHNYEHSHEHVHGHEYNQGHEHLHGERNYNDICELIDNSGLKPDIKSFSKEVFLEIARAEGKVHNKDINEVHFHEVGAVDSIVDIVGTAICLDLLGVDKIYSSALHDGQGTIKCRHGIIPVPVPAVMEMLADSNIPLISEDVSTELVTPTGMALIKKMSGSFGLMPAMLVEKTGYGMGKRDTGRLNALRVVLGTLPESNFSTDEIIILETNIDDTTSETLGYVSEKLLQSGALDVFYTPIYMKKNRPAYMLTVLANLSKEAGLVEIILRQTSTLGIRKSSSSRYCMQRETVTVLTEYGEARVKIASMNNFKKASPEYEDCKKIADSTGLTLKIVYDAVMRKAEQYLR